jgi:hypothetical protein
MNKKEEKNILRVLKNPFIRKKISILKAALNDLIIQK